MNKNDRDYIFHEYTTSICHQCGEAIPAKLIIKADRVYLLKSCVKHGEQTELFEEDVPYFLKKRDYDKPGTASKTQTRVEKGCPFDCGLCPQHDQHTCIGLIEVTKQCDMHCNICYADAGKGEPLPMPAIERMMDFYMEAESGSAEVLQISGGEPATHPQIIDIIALAKSKKFKYVMLNTNGLRLAEDEAFVQQLSSFVGGFEVYLQFDGFDDRIYKALRGREMADIKKKAIENLTKYRIPTTLVCTVRNGVNDREIGRLVEFGINTKYIRGINFQPLGYFGRAAGDAPGDRMTLSGVLRRIEKQTGGMIRLNDFIPLPCNVERVSITYLYRDKKGFVPITRNARIKDYLPLINNTFAFTIEDTLKETGKAIFSGNCCRLLDFLSDFKNFVPVNFLTKSREERMDYIDENTFRISVSSFIDVHNFDMKSMQKECVHIITPDLRRIPFSAYNMFHRR